MLPPQLVKYLATNFNVWHLGLELLGRSIIELETVNDANFRDVDKITDSTLDAMAEIYSLLSEDDMFCGLCNSFYINPLILIGRRRCLYPETNAALTYDQIGMWIEAQKVISFSTIFTGIDL